jgi:hypothetical protein
MECAAGGATAIGRAWANAPGAVQRYAGSVATADGGATASHAPQLQLPSCELVIEHAAQAQLPPCIDRGEHATQPQLPPCAAVGAA